MTELRDNRNQKFDWSIIFSYLALLLIGFTSIYAAGFEEGKSNPVFDFGTRHGKQLIYIAISLILGFVILLAESNVFSRFAYIIYLFMLVLLIGVLLFGTEIRGSKSWFRIGGFGIQPSELAKFATALALAKFLSILNLKLKDVKTNIVAHVIFLFPMGLILLQGDLGTSLAFTGFFIVLYRAGLSISFSMSALILIFCFVLTLLLGKWVVIAVASLIFGIYIWLGRRQRYKPGLKFYITGALAYVFCFLFVFVGVGFVFNKVMKGYHRDRVMVVLGKKNDDQNAAFQVNNSKFAIAAGGVFGKGYLQGGLTKGDHVPDQSTDFIFSTIGEEFGFLGSMVVIGLFLYLMLRITFLAERQRSKFSQLYAYGVAALLFVHFTVNIGTVLGLFPVAGIPLPLISAGGSATIGFTILLGILVRLDSQRLFIFR